MAYREAEIGLLARLRPDEAAVELRAALTAAKWDIEAAAADLDISVPTLYRLAARLVHHGHELIGEARQQREAIRRGQVYDIWICERVA